MYNFRFNQDPKGELLASAHSESNLQIDQQVLIVLGPDFPGTH